MHAKSRIHATFLYSYTSSYPVTTFFIFSFNSSLSPFHVLHLIRKCFTSSISPLSHSVHFSSVFKPVHLPTSTCSSAAPPPPLSFFSILLIFFLLTPTYLASNPPLTSSFNTHSFGCSSNSSTHSVVTCLHTQFFSMYFTTVFDMPFTLSNLTLPQPKSARHRSKFSRHFTFPFSDSAAMLYPFHQPFFSHRHNLVPKFNTSRPSFPCTSKEATPSQFAEMS